MKDKLPEGGELSDRVFREWSGGRQGTRGSSVSAVSAKKGTWGSGPCLIKAEQSRVKSMALHPDSLGSKSGTIPH